MEARGTIHSYLQKALNTIPADDADLRGYRRRSASSAGRARGRKLSYSQRCCVTCKSIFEFNARAFERLRV